MTRWPAAVLTAVLALSVAACSSEPEAERDEGGAVATEGSVDAFSVALGDCLEDSISAPEATPSEAAGEEVDAVQAVPCDQPHGSEVYALFDLPEGEYPGDEAVTVAAEEGCLAEWDAFVGKPYEESVLDFFTFQPTQRSWDEGDDREVVCVIGDPEAAEVTGTLRDAAR